MSSLIGFNIGGNPRGILNLGSTINSPLSGTLQAVTDGMGNASPLQLSTTEASVLGNFSVGAAVNATGFGQRIRVIGQGDASVGVYRNQATSSPAKFEFMKSRGTYDSPLVVNNLDEIGSLGYFAFNGTSYSNSARVYARAVSSTGTGVEGELLTTLWNNTGSNFHMLRLTLTGLGIGNSLDYTPSARLHVRGDGTNPIARFENSSGSSAWAITATGSALTCESQARIQGPAIANDSSVVLGSFNNLTTTTLTQTILTTQGNIVCAAGSGNKRISSIEYGINNSGAQTGTATGIFLNATETALNGMTHNLMDLQVGGVSAFRVDKNDAYVGQYGAGSTKLYLNGTNGTRPFIGTSAFQLTIDMGSYNFNIARLGNNHVIFDNNGNHTLNLIANTLTRFGGQTNAFPALKRNGAALEVRLADDSGFADIGLRNVIMGNVNFTSGNFQMDYNCTNHRFNNFNGSRMATISGTGFGDVFFIIGANTANASAILQADSTTKGFLPPRGTNAQMLAIATPATGLVFYDTTNNKLNVYDGTTWQPCW